jgi:hypothetical protein
MISDLTRDHFGRLSFSIGGKRIQMRLTPYNTDRFFAFAKSSEEELRAAGEPATTQQHWTDGIRKRHRERAAILEIALNPKPDEVTVTRADIEENMDINETLALADYWLNMLSKTELDPNAIRLATAR